METNLKLRTEVLEYALLLEYTVSSLIKAYFFIDKENPRTISNKSGGLSHKNQVDLLFDFDILNKQEYSALIKMMEFRNQFMHNYQCNSFNQAVEFLGSDKGKFLLKYLKPEDKDVDLELQYLTGYRNCFIQIQGILLERIRDRKDDISFKADFMKHNAKKILSLIDKHNRIMKELVEKTLMIFYNHKIKQAAADEFSDMVIELTKKSKFGQFRERKKYKLTDELARKILK